MDNIEAVLFDLDGTLIDTAPDMVGALNRLLQAHEQQPLTFEQARNTVSNGASALIKLGFGSDISDTRLQVLLQQFLQTYAEHVCIHSTLFNGIAELLQQLEHSAIPWGIVTNKPGWLTRPLLEQMQLWHRSACTVSGDDLPQRKPHPDPLLHACEQIGCAPHNTVYIGDHQRDVEAGRAANMPTIIALYGYIASDELPLAWGADGMISHAGELQDWLKLPATLICPQ